MREHHPVSEPSPELNFSVRPMFYGDLGRLVRDLGPTIEELYPDGASSLHSRLAMALIGKGTASVVSLNHIPTLPIALSSEISKGDKRLKLSTFWVAPGYRKLGVGRQLLSTRVENWIRQDIESVHVTVRREREAELARLFSRFGFRRIGIDLSRYGEGQDEAILQWRPEWSLATVEPSGDLAQQLA